MIHRRTMLLTSIGGRLLLACPAQGQPAASPDPLAPWAAAPASRDVDWRRRALAWAVLAPNPHNRQPWLVELDGAESVVLRCDLERRLPVTDPLDRQITIGLGCFAELFRMAAAAEGRSLAIAPFPDGVPTARLDGRAVARFTVQAGRAAADPLFVHALERRSAKRPFDAGRPVGADRLAALVAATGAADGGGAVVASEAPALVETLRALTWQAWLAELESPPALRESVDLMRLGQAEVAARPDGISLFGPGLDPAIAAGALTREAFATPGSQAWVATVDRYRAMLAATPAYVWTTSAGDGLGAAFAAGKQWLRLNLAATSLGLALHPVSQALQEYPAMSASFRAIHDRLGMSGNQRVQMLGRIGFLAAGPAVPPTPRWPADTRILRG